MEIFWNDLGNMITDFLIWLIKKIFRLEDEEIDKSQIDEKKPISSSIKSEISYSETEKYILELMKEKEHKED